LVSISGQSTADGLPNGRGTIVFESGDRFEGRFSLGKKCGRGTFYFCDGSSLSGIFKDDALNGKGLYTYEDGSCLVGTYTDGELNGPAEEFDQEGKLTFRGSYMASMHHGLCYFWDGAGACTFGVVDRYGHLSGNDITYVYPDKQTALKGRFKDGELIEAQLAIINYKADDFTYTDQDTLFTRDVSTRDKISNYPFVRDPFENKRSFVAQSTIPCAGEGLFSKIDVAADEVMSFYNGIRLTHKEVDARDWKYNSNTISLDEETVIDVPEDLSDLATYCASLGHKANHSFTPNSKYDRYDHPRFGKIKCIRTIKPVKAGEELTVEYGYDHNGLGINNPDAPQWYKSQYQRFLVQLNGR